MIEGGLYVDEPVEVSSSMQSFAVSNASTIPVAVAAAKRTCITFINQGANVLVLSQQSPNDGVRFIILPIAGGILVMDKLRYGSMIQGNWFATSLVGGTDLTVIDTVKA